MNDPDVAESSSVRPISPAQVAILRSAADLYQRRGFAATTMREVADHVGLSKAGLYHHYRSKEAILRDIAALAAGLLLEQLHAAQELDASPEARLQAFVRSRMELIAREQAVLTVVWQERPAMTEEAFAEVSAMLREYRAGATQLIRDAQDRARLRTDIDPRLIMLAIDGMTGWSYLWYRPDGGYEPNELGVLFWDLVWSGLASDGQASDVASPATT